MRAGCWSALLVLAILLAMCQAAAAQGVGFESAGVAVVQPLSGGQDSFLAYDFSGKLLPIEEPVGLSLRTVPQYIGANLHGDLLVYHKDTTGLPISLDDAKLAVGVSLPLYQTESDKTAVRAGLAYVNDTGAAAFATFAYKF